MPTPRIYNDPANGDESSIGPQMNTYFWIKKSLTEMKKKQFFTPLSSTFNMPKHYGKTIKKYVYLPILDDANINDQGIDANGATTTKSVSLAVTMADGSIPDIPYDGRPVNSTVYFEARGATAAAAADALIAKIIAWVEGPAAGGGLGLTLVGANNDEKFTDAVNDSDGLAYVLGYRFAGYDGVPVVAAAALDALAVAAQGNLYGSSKDIGYITGKFPVLGEEGGEVNRVGFTRKEIEGSMESYGLYSDYTEDSVNFDSDAELQMHVNREMLNAANELNEDLLQIDLLNSAGLVKYAGDAVSVATLSGETDAVTEVTYEDLSRLNIDLDNARCPKQTKIISGSRMIDTRVINGSRIMYIGSEMQPTFEHMADNFGDPAFIPVAKYAAAGEALNGEIGAVNYFRIVVVPEMMHWSGVGATETASNAGYRATGGKYDVFPLLVVGSESFTTIGFQTSGKNLKFRIKHSKPGSPESYANDKFGRKGFMSILWWYGFLLERSERIGLIKSVARI